MHEKREDAPAQQEPTLMEELFVFTVVTLFLAASVLGFIAAYHVAHREPGWPWGLASMACVLFGHAVLGMARDRKARK